MFTNLIGNTHAKTLLHKLHANNCLPPVLLFSGPQGVGKALFAGELAHVLLHSHKNPHPDLFVHAPTGKSELHTAETVREILQEAALPPFVAPVKVFIIHEAERMLAAASNALLKTLEEPHEKCQFILLAHDAEALLATVASRCCHIRFFPIPEGEIAQFLVTHKQCTQEKAQEIALRCEGSLGKACTLLQQQNLNVQAFFEEGKFPELKDEEIDLFLEECAYYFRKSSPEKLRTMLATLSKARLALERHVKLSAILQSLLLATN